MHNNFITFEGGEGVGKSTQILLLQQRFISAGREVVVTREPGGVPIAEDIRALVLKSGDGGVTSAISETLLFYAARNEHLQQKIIPALQQNRIVLCDRFHDSSHVYQHYTKGVPEKLLKQLDAAIINDYMHALTFLLDMPVEQAMKRRIQRGGAMDKFEAETLEFHTKIREGFLSRAKAKPQRIVVIDAEQSQDAVANDIYNACKARGLI